ncbi:MAG: hypothetical protein ACLTZT_07970 [Butyricimonas faecalis]
MDVTTPSYPIRGIIVMGCIMQIIDWPLALKWWALFLIMESRCASRYRTNW